MTILRLSACSRAVLMRRPRWRRPARATAARPLPATQTTQQNEHKRRPGLLMSSLWQTAEEGWGPLWCSAAGRMQHPRSQSVGRAAARLVRATARWHLRRLERRIAALEIDERTLN